MAGLLRLSAIIAASIVAIGFLAFATDEANTGSTTQQEKLADELNTPAPAADGERAREREHGAVREGIDDANDFLLQPFTGVTSASNSWVQRGVPTVLALLAYGLGLMLLANYLPKPRNRGGSDWRTT